MNKPAARVIKPKAVYYSQSEYEIISVSADRLEHRMQALAESSKSKGESIGYIGITLSSIATWYTAPPDGHTWAYLWFGIAVCFGTLGVATMIRNLKNKVTVEILMKEFKLISSTADQE